MIRAMGSGSLLKSRAGIREGATQALVRASIRPVLLAVASTMALRHEHLWDECDTLTRVGRADRAEFDAVDSNAPRCLHHHRFTKLAPMPTILAREKAGHARARRHRGGVARMWQEAQRGPNDLRLVKAKERQRECRFARPGPADYRRLHATRLSFHAYTAMRAVFYAFQMRAHLTMGRRRRLRLWDTPTRNRACASLRNRVA